MSNFLVYFLFLGFIGQPLVAAEAEQSYDRINLTVDASREVENDTLEAVLFYQKEGNNVARLASEVNKKIANAVLVAKKNSEIKVQTLGYRTIPVYRNQLLTGWRVKQSIRLESLNAAELSGLIGKLQETLSIQSVGYNISDSKRHEAEDGLISEAINLFQKRAALITETLGRSTFHLVQMDVNTQRISPNPVRRTMTMATEASVATPTLQAGTQTVRVTIRATIELIVN